MDSYQPKPLFKGIPFHAQQFSREQIANAGWNILQEDLPLPCAIIKKHALLQNSLRMNQWLERNDLLLAPHIKTTMSPELIFEQLADGVWGLTVANVTNSRLAAQMGAKHIIFANQLVGRANIKEVELLLAEYPDLIMYLFIDSLDAFELLKAANIKNRGRLKLLIELGAYGGRCGVREAATAKTLIEAIYTNQWEIAGFSAYEAVFEGSDEQKQSSVQDFLSLLDSTICAFIEQQTIVPAQSLIISIGGSEYYDMCALTFARLQHEYDAKIVLRSGCYLFSDSGVYEKASMAIDDRLGSAQLTLPASESAIEVWCYVLSQPEPGVVILGAGKRDFSYDKGLPKPLYAKSKLSSKITPIDHTNYQITRINDQHCFLRVPIDDSLAPGDMVAVGISHPCTTFDKWRKMLIVDGQYNVIDAIQAWF
ncbi:alanine racemase [Aliiglaciecola sp. 2_MG-2023]|uniref:alanine racemase n=1 Tax=unclassified Aliiglaciecola TaxID=2593648 RepID=UPI0026E3C55A|nr:MULTISPECIES: alanine racemase [unclassified Aliiglaciecola]MDO6711910.1 alanine racemase [Aliiglaciecola sp. 2_MG-2023]MDO6753116.1 alanine racemase [Aliiglaciecola sp. 1_MG-2023]